MKFNPGKINVPGILAIATVLILGLWWVYLSSKSSEVKPVARQSESREVFYQKQLTQAEGLVNSPRTQSYENETYKFSLSYPEEFEVSEMTDEQGDTIVFEDPLTGLGFQIYITDFDEPSSNVTIERIQKDLPKLVIRDPRDVEISDLGKGLAFISERDGVEVREVWLAFRGGFYQITAPMSFDMLLPQILGSWTFL